MVLIRKVARKNSSGPFKSTIPKTRVEPLASDSENEDLKEIVNPPEKEEELKEIVNPPQKRQRKRRESKPKEVTLPKESKERVFRVRRPFGSGKTCAEEIAKIIISNGNKEQDHNDIFKLFGDRIKEVFPNGKKPNLEIC